MPTFYRGPIKYATTGTTPAIGSAGLPYLNGILQEFSDQLAVMTPSLPDEGPREFGLGFSALNYPGPYTASATNGGITTNALTNGGTITQQGVLGGDLRLTTGAASGNQDSFTTAKVYQVVAGKRLWFEIRFSLVAVAGQALMLGLADTVGADITAAGGGATNGIFFLKTGAGTDLSFSIRKAGTSSTVSNILAAAGVAALTNGTVLDLGFLVDAGQGVGATPTITSQGAISCYVNGRFGGAFTSADANIPTVVLGLAVATQTSAVATASMDLFQLLACEEL